MYYCEKKIYIELKMRIETKEHNNLHEYIKTLSAIKHHPHTYIFSPC